MTKRRNLLQTQRARAVILSALVFATMVGIFTTLRAQSPTPPPPVTRPLAPLNSVRVPRPARIDKYIRNRAAAIALGKALFWDMQVGSDGVTACASCHSSAGADSRAINQVSPGLKRVLPAQGDPFPTFSDNADESFQVGGPNYHLTASDFPLHKPSPPCPDGALGCTDDFTNDINDVISSQGVHASKFIALAEGSSIDNFACCGNDGVPSDTVFNLNGLETRKVEPRNTPTVINAVFNHRNFWDGRAQNACNFLNPFGTRDQDPSHHLYQATGQGLHVGLAAVKPTLPDSSLCSQALGPPTSLFEMSSDGRSMRDLGRKLLAASPLASTALPSITALGRQAIDPTDSVLGLRRHKKFKRGLQDSYAAMVQQAFDPRWWQSKFNICVAADGGEALINARALPAQSCPAGATKYTLAEYNFSLFWGLAIQEYESTLVADKAPVDRYLAQLHSATMTPIADGTTTTFTGHLIGPVTPDSVTVVGGELIGTDAFGTIAHLDNLRVGTVDYSTGAVAITFIIPPPAGTQFTVKYNNSANPPLTPQQIKGMNLFTGKGSCISCHSGPEMTNAAVANVKGAEVERMAMSNFGLAVYDTGFYNIGVRPTHDDVSNAATDPWNNPLSNVLRTMLRVCNNGEVFIVQPKPGERIPASPLLCGERTAIRGTFKAPSLRNVELTAPYFHNGGTLTLEQVVDFYDRGGDFPHTNQQDLDPDIEPIGFTPDERAALVSFLKSLTDARVRYHQAPFDHPEIWVPNGHTVDASGDPVPASFAGQAADNFLQIKAVGRRGYTAPLPTFEQNLRP
jgi:cytochrome c peroxidase